MSELEKMLLETLVEIEAASELGTGRELARVRAKAQVALRRAKVMDPGAEQEILQARGL